MGVGEPRERVEEEEKIGEKRPINCSAFKLP